MAEWWDIVSKRDPAVVTMILSGSQTVGHAKMHGLVLNLFALNKNLGILKS